MEKVKAGTSRLGGTKTLKVTGFLDEFEKDEVKKKVDLVSLFGSFGVILSKKGKSHMGKCPWHDDSTPSLSVDREKGLYNCFGCGESGDAITLVQKMKGLDFPGAVKFLKKDSSDFTSVKAEPAPARDQAKSPSVSPPAPADLTAVSDFYQKKLSGSKDACSYLESRGLTDRSLWNRFGIGYSDGSLVGVLSDAQKRALGEAGVLNEKGGELFYKALVIPLLDQGGRVVSFYGRSIDSASTLPHRYLPGDSRGLMNGGAFKAYRDQLIFTESVIDALSLIQMGIQNVIPLYGTNGFCEDHLKALKDERVQKVVIAFDGDEAGQKGASKLSKELITQGIATSIISPPDHKDWNQALMDGLTRAQFESLLSSAEVLEPPKPKDSPVLEKKGSRYLFTTGGLIYRLLGVKEGFVSSLRVNIQVKKQQEDERFIDNVDLFSARSRSSFAAALSGVFALEKARVEKDLISILEALEEERDKVLSQSEEEEIHLTEDEIALGMELLQSPDLFERIEAHSEVLGYVGEDVNKKLLYIAASSRKLDDPISVIVLSASASGKSYLVDTIKKLIPPEDVVAMTSLSEQALNYLPEEGLLHKFLVMGEAVHGQVIEHQIREMLSARELSRLVVTKDEKTGILTSRMVRKKVLVSCVMSSTNYDLNAENASRSFVINTDESTDQTLLIHQKQRQKYSLARYKDREARIPRIIHQHHCAQRLLEKRVIVNSFGDLLDFPSSMMRARRDHERFMDLIACVCFLRQFQKQESLEDGVRYIACDLEDYRIAYRLMSAILPSTLTNFPRAAQDLYERIRGLLQKKAKVEELEVDQVSITQREIREASGLGQVFVKRNVRILCDYEYLVSSGSGARGSKRSYRLYKDERLDLIDLTVIPTPEQMEVKLQKL